MKFLQYEEFLAYVSVKAGFLYCLLNDNQAERARKEVFTSYARILGCSEVWRKKIMKLLTV